MDTSAAPLELVACTPAVRFRVSWPAGLEAELEPVARALSSFPATDDEGIDVEFRVEPNRDDIREAYTLSSSGEGPLFCVDENQVTSAIVGRLNRLHLDRDTDHLHIHAAGLALGDRGVILAGPSGSGKSTAAAALVMAGFDYLTDEIVGLDDHGCMCGYPKPITLKPGSWPAVASIVPSPPPAASESGRRWEIPPDAIRAGVAPSGVVPAVVARIVYDPAGGPATTQFDPITSLTMLVENSSDIARFGPAALPRLARVVAGCAGVEVRFRDLVAVAPAIEPLVATSRPRLAVEELTWSVEGEALGSGDLSRDVAPVRGVCSVVMDGESVVHDRQFDHIMALGSAGTEVWRLLDGTRTIDRIVSEVAGAHGAPPDAAHRVSVFLETLAGRGLISRGDANNR